MSHPSLLRVAIVQQLCSADAQTNLASTEAAVARAADAGARLIILPELHTLPYFCQEQDPAHFDRAEALDGASATRLAQWAQRYQLVIVGSLFERRAAGLYHNTAVVFERDGRVAGIYRKMHIPDDPGFYEKYYFTPGDQGFVPIQTSVGRLGVLVCWDQWYPEAARLMALAGAEVLLYPTAIGWDPRDPQDEQQRQLESWTIIQRAHAVANGLPVLVANRVGLETTLHSRIQFWGHSFVAGPQGELLAQAQTDETLLLTEVDLSACERVRRIWPFLRDRRIDAYGGLLQRFGA
ncbi:MAG TPA: carbon-nitrogen hydrolase [Acidiferrobacteraceae bacterium]|nr:carbon-nitrogen hydrolase [Acidiferrobacteraceae bacterium]